jgi:uncharacterized phiE125 gp8 family phage protein
MPSYQLLTPPALEPVTLAEAKDWLKIDGSDEDQIINALIISARLSVEAATGLMLITQSWRLAFDAWPLSGRLNLIHAPLQTVSALRIYDVNGMSKLLDLTGLDVSSGRQPKLVLKSALPQSSKMVDGIELDLILGFGNSAASVPEDLKLAIKMLVAFWHENRGDGTSGVSVRWPDSISALLHPFMPRRV